MTFRWRQHTAVKHHEETSVYPRGNAVCNNHVLLSHLSDDTCQIPRLVSSFQKSGPSVCYLPVTAVLKSISLHYRCVLFTSVSLWQVEERSQQTSCVFHQVPVISRRLLHLFQLLHQTIWPRRTGNIHRTGNFLDLTWVPQQITYSSTATVDGQLDRRYVMQTYHCPSQPHRAVAILHLSSSDTFKEFPFQLLVISGHTNFSFI